MRLIDISQETRSADSVTSLDHKQLPKTIKCRYIAIKWMIVINMSCRVKKHICDLPTSDT